MASIPESASYSALYYADRERWRDRFVESAAAVDALGLVPGPLVIDVGCGTGPLFPLLRGRGLVPIGVETNARAARQAAARPGGTAIRVGATPRLPFGSAVAGGIIAQHLIEHLAIPDDAVRDWWRVLQPGGRVVVVTPNRDHPDGALFADPDHRVLFGPGSLTAMLEAARFRVRALYGLFPYFGTSRASRALSRRAWRLARWPAWRGRARTLLIVGERPRTGPPFPR